MASTDNILEKICERPGMYTGEGTLTSIRHFLSGYDFAIHQNDLPTNDDPLLIPGEFHDWVAYRLRFYESTSGWCNMICERTDTDRDAIDSFLQLLNEFKARKPHVVAKLIGFKKSYQQMSSYRNDKGEVVQTPMVTKEYPNSISLVTFTEDPGFFAYSDTEESFPEEGYHPDLEHFELYSGANRKQLSILDEDWNPQPFQDA